MGVLKALWWIWQLTASQIDQSLIRFLPGVRFQLHSFMVLAQLMGSMHKSGKYEPKLPDLLVIWRLLLVSNAFDCAGRGSKVNSVILFFLSLFFPVWNNLIRS